MAVIKDVVDYSDVITRVEESLANLKAGLNAGMVLPGFNTEQTKEELERREALFSTIRDLNDRGEDNPLTQQEADDLKEKVTELEEALDNKSPSVECSPWEQVEVSDDLTVKFKDPNMSVQGLIDQLEAKGVKFDRYDSFADSEFLKKPLAGEFRVVDKRCNEKEATSVLRREGCSTEPDCKLENFAAMLTFYLKDLSGEQLSNNERRLLGCYDGRNKPEREDYRFVRCGASSSVAYIGADGSVFANDEFYSLNQCFASGGLSRN